ncbi:MAG: hypothetical protein GY800_06755 [Planctomycetes bacterium]|nr:hypothetical protein [Planctomycetota bacterium]
MEDSGQKHVTAASLFRPYDEAVQGGGRGMRPNVTHDIMKNYLALRLDGPYSIQYVQDAMEFFLKPLALSITSTPSSIPIRVSRHGISI